MFQSDLTIYRLSRHYSYVHNRTIFKVILYIFFLLAHTISGGGSRKKCNIMYEFNIYKLI